MLKLLKVATIIMVTIPNRYSKYHEYHIGTYFKDHYNYYHQLLKYILPPQLQLSSLVPDSHKLANLKAFPAFVNASAASSYF